MQWHWCTLCLCTQPSIFCSPSFPHREREIHSSAGRAVTPCPYTRIVRNSLKTGDWSCKGSEDAQHPCSLFWPLQNKVSRRWAGSPGPSTCAGRPRGWGSDEQEALLCSARSALLHPSLTRPQLSLPSAAWHSHLCRPCQMVQGVLGVQEGLVVLLSGRTGGVKRKRRVFLHQKKHTD